MLIVPHRRELLVDGRAIDLGGRAFDILELLIAAQGELVSKDEIMQRVWPGAVVEENTLQVHVSALRKMLGDNANVIRTISRRGYRLVGDAGEATARATLPRTNLPNATSELVGREDALAEVGLLLKAHRIVTLTGTGGIGKTRLALDVARRMLPEFPDGVWLVELASLSDPALVPDTVAGTLGLELSGGGSSDERIARAVGTRRLLLVLDNCEHVIDAAANLAEAMLRGNPGLHLLVTSREPLRSTGEWLYRVPPLDVPEAGTDDTGELLRHGAMRLFVARAHAAEGRIVLDARSVATMAALCRRLDGMPLAIELAASRAAMLGVEEVAARLDDRFALLTGGHRTALPRHQTLRATLDWSHELLTDAERVLLRRLAIFAGGFTLEAASVVAVAPDITTTEGVDGISNLVAKSLVAIDMSGARARYGMLETTRAYALEKLAESGELDCIARRHAEYFRDLFFRAEGEATVLPAAEWLAAYGRWIDNVRVALDWAFSARGDAALGVALTVCSVPLWVQWSLLAECRTRVERALASAGPESGQDPSCRMQLYAALGAALTYTRGPMPETGDAWARALAIAEGLDDIGCQLQALRGLWIFRLSRGACRDGLVLAEKFSGLAARTADPGDLSMAERMTGVSLHYLGELDRSRLHIERILHHSLAVVRGSHAARLLLDQPITAHALLARTLWLQGFADMAMREAGQVVDDAGLIEHGLPLCHALAQAACPIALFVGDLAAAGKWVAMLIDHATRHGLGGWAARGECFQGVLMIRGGDPAAGMAFLRNSLEKLRKTGLAMYFIAFLGELAHALGQSGAADEAMVAIDEALARSERDGERWCMAELLRIKGKLLARQGEAGAAEAHFLQAIDWARRQGALSWELRAAMSLVRLRPPQARGAAALAGLAPVFARFSEGFATADLAEAATLLR